MELHEFLAARYAEARAREESKWTVRDCPYDWEYRRDRDDEYVLVDRVRIEVKAFVEQYGVSAADPAVLADLDAKENVLKEHKAADTRAAWPDFEGGVFSGLDTALQHLAVPFASHPDYREEWKP
jgi:hypothetical protein